MTGRDRRRRGVVLPLVLIIALMLTASIATFAHRATLDRMIVRNRDRAAAAEALAAGGVQIARAVAFQSRYAKQLQAYSQGGEISGSSLQDVWARLGQSPLTTPWGGELVVTIEDAGARLNLNALVPSAAEGLEAGASEEAEEFLVAFLEKVLDEMELQTEERLYDPREMARHLLDYMDRDDVAIAGPSEDDYYMRQDPPFRSANRPLLSVEEIAMVEGFDAQVARAMKPYVTVYPLLGEQGINVNTAPPHVLALIYQGSSGDRRLSDEDTVRSIMQVRENEQIVCTQTETDPDRCVGLAEIGLATGSIYPEATLPMEATHFLIRSEANVEGIVRTVEAVVDLSDREQARLLSWRAR